MHLSVSNSIKKTAFTKFGSRFILLTIGFMEIHRTGKETHLERVFIRGSQIRFFILPDMLKNAPMFNRELAKKTAVRGIDIGSFCSVLERD